MTAARKGQGKEAAVATQSTPPCCIVYTAGSCEQNPGRGECAYLQVGDGTVREESGEHPDTTTIRMELSAARKALETTAPGSMVLVCKGSQLVQQAMTGWVHNGWRTGAAAPRFNRIFTFITLL